MFKVLCFTMQELQDKFVQQPPLSKANQNKNTRISHSEVVFSKALANFYNVVSLSTSIAKSSNLRSEILNLFGFSSYYSGTITLTSNARRMTFSFNFSRLIPCLISSLV